MLKVSSLEIIEVGQSKPFRVMYDDKTAEMDSVLWMLSTSSTLKLINDSGGYDLFLIESRWTEEREPNEFAYTVRVRKQRVPGA